MGDSASGAGSGPVYDEVVRMLRVIGDDGREGAICAISSEVSLVLVPLADLREREVGSYSTFESWWDSDSGENAKWQEGLGEYSQPSAGYDEIVERLKATWDAERPRWLNKGSCASVEQDETLAACGIIAAAYGIPFDADLIRTMAASFVERHPNWNSSKCY